MKPLILVLLCLSVTWRGVRAAESEPPAPIADDARPSPEIQAGAEKEIAQLSSDDFDQRQAALKKLQEMDLTLLPWLRRVLKEDVQDVAEAAAYGIPAPSRACASLKATPTPARFFSG